MATVNSFNTGQVLVNNSATEILAANPQRERVTLWSRNSSIVYVGKDNTVTVSTGFPLGTNGSSGVSQSNLVLESTSAIYGITNGDTDTVYYLEEVRA